MKDSNFTFLQTTYPDLFTLGELAEKLISIDPNSSLTKSRLFAEKLTALIWSFEELDATDETQVYKINKLYNEEIIPEIIKDFLHLIRKSGNRATHTGNSSKEEALFVLKKLFKLSTWFYETYENVQLSEINYNEPTGISTDNEIDELNSKLQSLEEQVLSYKDKITALNNSASSKQGRRKRSISVASLIDLNEDETRIMLIDPALRKAGWECDTHTLNFRTHRTMPAKGRNMAIAEWQCGSIRADYALFIGTTLYGIVEAKRFSADISTNLHQSKIYSCTIEEQDGIVLLGNWSGNKVPFLFSTNGRQYLEQIKTKSGIWFADTRKPTKKSEPIRDWYSPEGLEKLYERDIDEVNQRLMTSSYDYLTESSGLSLYDYQINAIKAIEQKIINGGDDKRALLVMATGTGKTRTAIGLAYRLIKSNRFKRILFLTDRRLLAEQAFGDFKDKRVEDFNTFTEIYKVSSLKDVLPDAEARLHFATVQGLVRRLFYNNDENEKSLSIDSYDCIIVDEAHRGYNLDRELDDDDLSFRDQDDYVSQYKRVIEYFDSHIIGLTATPALHTTQIFGAPVFTYSYREAVIDNRLVDHEPPYLIKTKLSEEGIVWKQGERPKAYDPETNSIEELAELEDELHIEVEQFNKRVITPNFNRTVIKELVQHIDPEGEGKTLIFAVRDSHADMIVDMLFEEYEAIGLDVHRDAIRKITGNVYDPLELTRLFRNEKYPNIAVTVDLLTTGVDIPQITNLVFMRRVNSRILFEQMLGRATRKCDEIGKEYFQIYDAVGVYDALKGFSQMQTVSNPSFSFKQLIDEFDHIDNDTRKKRQIEQIIAKLQRKKRDLTDDKLDQFVRLSEGNTPEDFIHKLRKEDITSSIERIRRTSELWDFLDERIYRPKTQLLSEHEDRLRRVERGYGNAKKPEDYIESFKEYILNNKEKIEALKIVCNKPSELDRKSLKELKLILDQQGFNVATLNQAWHDAKNEDIAADIIAYIRTFALDVMLVTPEQRVKGAIQKVKAMQSWNAIQLKWIDRFEKQLIAETILTKEDLDKEPFKNDGGYIRINKIFSKKLDMVLHTINEYLYSA